MSSSSSIPIVAVFAGLPSAGKSSAINALVGKNYAHTGMGRTTVDVAVYGASPLPSVCLPASPSTTAIKHYECKLTSEEKIPFHLVDLPGCRDAQESSGDDIKKFDDLTDEWVAKADIIYWLSDAKTAFNTTHEKADFDKIVANAKARNAQNGIFQKTVIMLTKYNEPPASGSSDANNETDAELSDASDTPDELEIKYTDGVIKEETTYADALGRVKKMYPDLFVITFNAHGRISHYTPQSKISSALRTFVKKVSPGSYKSHMTFALGWYVEQVKSPKFARENSFLDHWDNYVMSGVGGTAESAKNAFKQVFGYMNKYISPDSPFVKRVVDTCVKAHDEPNISDASPQMRLLQSLTQGCFAKVFMSGGFDEHLHGANAFLSPAFLAKSAIHLTRTCLSSNKIHDWRDNICFSCKIVNVGNAMCVVCNTSGPSGDNHAERRCHLMFSARRFFDYVCGLQIPDDLKSFWALSTKKNAVAVQIFNCVAASAIDDATAVKLSSYLKYAGSEQLLVTHFCSRFKNYESPFLKNQMSHCLQILFKLFGEMNINSSKCILIEQHFWRLYSILRYAPGVDFIEFTDAKYKPLSTATKLVESLIKDKNLIASSEFLELVKTERSRLWGVNDSEKCIILNLAALAINNPCLLMAPTDMFAFSL